MEPTHKELSLDESVKQVMQTLPPPIRNYLAQGKYTAVAKGLMTKYRLHIDQATILEREIMLLLMGIEDPAEFAKTLSEEAKLDQQTVNGIVQDVNAQIFVPIRDEMRKGTPSTVPTPPKATQSTARPQQVPPAAQKYAPIPKFPHLLQNPPSPQLRQGYDGHSKAMEGTAITTPDKKLLEDHEELHIEFKKVPEPPPPNLPGAIHHPPLPVPPPLPKPVPPTVPPPKPTIVPPPARPYSSDPYREPIDEK